MMNYQANKDTTGTYTLQLCKREKTETRALKTCMVTAAKDHLQGKLLICLETITILQIYH